MYTKHPARQWVTLLDNKFEKIPHLRGFISLENVSEKSWKIFRFLIAYFSVKKIV